MTAGSYSDDQLIAAIRHRMQVDRQYRNDLHNAVATQSNAWLRRLISTVALVVLGVDFGGIVDAAAEFFSSLWADFSGNF